MKAALLLSFAASLCSFASAATVAYTFEGNNNNATIVGSSFSASSLTEGGTLSTGAIYGGFTSTTSPTDTTTVRAFLPSNIANQTAPSITSHSTYVQFTLTPAAGQTLDFSAASFVYTFGAATGISSNNDMPAYSQAGFSINSGTFTALGGVLSSTAPPYNSAAPNWASNAAAGGFATGVNFDVLQNTASISLASVLAGLNPGDTVTFRIAIGDNSTISTALTASSGVLKTAYVDDIGISGLNVIPEPTVSLLGLSGFAAAALRRRRA